MGEMHLEAILNKDLSGSTELLLCKDGDRIGVVELRKGYRRQNRRKASGGTDVHEENDRIDNDRNHDANSGHAHNNKGRNRPVRARSPQQWPEHQPRPSDRGVLLPKYWHPHPQPQERRSLQRMTICSWRRSFYCYQGFNR
jgi:hypothetical protein